MDHPYTRHDGGRLWTTIQSALDELVANRDVALSTAPEYVTGYLCAQIRAIPIDDEAPVFYHHRAALRIMGKHLPVEQISGRLGLQPTHAHREGGHRGSRATTIYAEDMWTYAPPVAEEREMGEHLDKLHETMQPHLGYLRELKTRWDVDIFCAYTSSSSTAGFAMNPRGLRLAVELEVPLHVSVLVV